MAYDCDCYEAHTHLEEIAVDPRDGPPACRLDIVSCLALLLGRLTARCS